MLLVEENSVVVAEAHTHHPLAVHLALAATTVDFQAATLDSPAVGDVQAVVVDSPVVAAVAVAIQEVDSTNQKIISR